MDSQEKIVILSLKEIKDIIEKLETYKKVLDKGYRITPKKSARDALAIESCELGKMINNLKKDI